MNYGKRKALTFSGENSPQVGGVAKGWGNQEKVKSSDRDGEEYDEDKDCNKRKSRNLSEKKRRDQFNMLINELCCMVSTNNRKMDKTTVLKSTISFLKAHKEMAQQTHAHEITEDWKPSFLSNEEFAQLMLEALDGFLLVITQSGTILYSSESVTSILNHLPSDLVNHSFFDLTHPTEKIHIYNLILSHQMRSGHDLRDFEKDENQLSFTCHLKCGRMSPDESPDYECVECIGNFCTWNSATSYISDENLLNEASLAGAEVCFCATVKLKCTQVIRELSTVDDSKREFTSRHSMEWQFLYLDHRGPPIIGYLPYEVLGISGFDYYHPDDLEKVAKCHEQLMQTGKGTSCYYRFLTKGQQWIWLQTSFYITYHQWNSKPEFINCTNEVVSYAEVRQATWKELGYNGEKDIAEKDLEENKSQDGPSSSSVWVSTPKKPDSPPSFSKGSKREKEVIADTTEHIQPGKRPAVPQSAIITRIVSASPTQRRPDTTHIATQQTLTPASVHAIQQQQTAVVATTPSLSPNKQSVVEVQTSEAQLYLTSAHVQLQEQLQQKHIALHKAILQQQEELRLISEQLMLVNHIAGNTPMQKEVTHSTSSDHQVVGVLPGGAAVSAALPRTTISAMMQTPVVPVATTGIMVPTPPALVQMGHGIQPLMIPMMLPQQQILLSSAAKDLSPAMEPNLQNIQTTHSPSQRNLHNPGH